MASVSQAFDLGHPLLKDRKRLDRIFDVMYAEIQKTLFPESPRRRQGNKTEQVLAGSATSADDVLFDSAADLLRFSPERLEGTWEGLAVTIAHNKAVDAVRASQKGLRKTEIRHRLRLVSGDAVRQGPEGEDEPPLFELIPSDWGDSEARYAVLEKVRRLISLARDILDERDRKIFFAIHFLGESRTEVGNRFGMTSQRIGQIYREALKSLEGCRNYPFQLDDQKEGGTDDQ